MKKRTFLLLALSAFLLPLNASAQHSSKAAETKQVASKKATQLTGLISLDGKTLVTEKNEIWTVSNPDVLAGHQGQKVLVKCQLFADKSEIHVFTLQPSEDIKSASNRADSAFRR